MKTLLKPTLIAMSLGLFSVTAPAISLADHHGDKTTKKAVDMKPLNHASFMPKIMKHLLKNQKELKLTPEQVTAFEGFHKEKSPMIHKMAKKVAELEAKAKQLTLDNHPPMSVIQAGGQSIQIRYDLMIAKLQCRDFVKSVLNEEQYKKALTTFK